MKSIFQSAGSLVAVLIAAAALTGCAAGQEEHMQHRPDAASATSPGGMGRGGSTGQMGMMGGAGPDGQKGMMGGADGQKGMMGGGAAGQKGMMGSGAGGQMGMMDKKSMCEMHDKMMSAKTPAERTAMMDDHMKNMSPEEKQKHMGMMKQQCK